VVDLRSARPWEESVSALTVAHSIAPYVRQGLNSQLLDSFRPLLAARIEERPDRCSLARVGGAVLAFAFLDPPGSGRLRKARLPYVFDQLGVTAHHDVTGEEEIDEVEGGIRNLHFLAAVALLCTKCEGLPERALVRIVPHPPDETRRGTVFDMAGFKPVDLNRTWRQGGAVETAASTVCAKLKPLLPRQRTPDDMQSDKS